MNARAMYHVCVSNDNDKNANTRVWQCTSQYYPALIAREVALTHYYEDKDTQYVRRRGPFGLFTKELPGPVVEADLIPNGPSIRAHELGKELWRERNGISGPAANDFKISLYERATRF